MILANRTFTSLSSPEGFRRWMQRCNLKPASTMDLLHLPPRTFYRLLKRGLPTGSQGWVMAIAMQAIEQDHKKKAPPAEASGAK